jgi:serine/threonine-protein kinase
MVESRDPSSADAPSRRSGPAADGSTSRAHEAAPADDATVISSALPPLASAAEIGSRLEGAMLGPYRLESFVGGGGMGAVFRALDTTLDRIVAVKVLAGRQADDEEMLRRFRVEAQSAARLDHENIGRVYAVGSEGGWHYIVFEFIEGRNVRDVVRADGPFDLARTVDVAIQVADALEHAAEREVVHRDIKPSNIVITPAGRARIVDMGLARVTQVAGDGDLTVSGMTLGTFDYISPEQARDPRAADVRSDLYSLGCTMFFMLAGRPPFAEGTMVQKLLQHQQEPPPDIALLRPDVPARCSAILARLMEKDPDARYQRPADLVADLLAFAEDQGIEVAASRSAAVATVTVAAGPPRPAVLPWLVPLLGLAAVVLALWGKAAADRRGPPPAPTAAGSSEGDRAVRESADGEG